MKFILYSSLLLFFFIFSENSFSQTYRIDSTFGLNGRQVLPDATGSSSFYDVEKQSDGKIVSSGNILNMNSDILVTRNSSTGIPDATFGVNGKAIIDLGADEFINDAAIQSDGKIVVCGNQNPNAPNTRFLVCRLNADGTKDVSFGNSGSVLIKIINGTTTDKQTFRNLLIQSDGKILVTGYCYVNTEYIGIVQRYKTNGTLDSTFGTDGSQFIKYTNGSNNFAEALHVTATGKILVLGNASFTTYGMRIMRLNSDGTADAGFGINSVVSIAVNGFNNVFPTWLKELPDGKILSVGYAFTTLGQRVYAMRHLSNGNLDPTFGINGVATYNVNNGAIYAYDAVLHANGQLSIAGENTSSGITTPLAIRIDSLGLLVNSFATNGIAVFAPADYAFGSAVTEDNTELVISGALNNKPDRYDQAFTLRVSASGSVITTYGNSGTLSWGSGISISLSNNIFLLNGGNLILSGTRFNKNRDQFAAKVNVTGNTISSFGSSGFSTFDLKKNETVKHSILYDPKKILLLSETGLQIINFTSPVVSLIGPIQYSLSAIDTGGLVDTVLQKNFTLTANEFPRAICVRQDGNGKLIVLAESSRAVFYDNFILRHNSDLTLDNSFGTAGKIKIFGSVSSSYRSMRDLQIAADNDMVILSNVYNNISSQSKYYFTLEKMKPNGNNDLLFGTNGTYTSSDTVNMGADNIFAEHLWKYDSGYFVSYHVNNIYKLINIGFNGGPGSFGTVALGSAKIADLIQLQDHSFFVICQNDSAVKIFKVLPNGRIDSTFNSATGFFSCVPFATKNMVTGAIFNPDSSMVFYHQLFNANNPNKIALSKISLKKNVVSNGLNESNSTFKLNSYPNPFVQQFILENPEPAAMNGTSYIQLLDINGKEMPLKIEKLAGNKYLVQSEIYLSSGIYFLRVTNSKGEIIINKLIRE